MHDHKCGNNTEPLDKRGAIEIKYAYDAFGRVLSQSEGISNPFKFVGAFGVMDEGNGLLFMRARYYDPATGRFISKDPIGWAGGDLNLYAYTGNNPVNFIDPSGLILWYANTVSESTMKTHIKQIMTTATGRKLLKKLHGDPKTYLIHSGSGPYGSAYQLGNDVYVDPSFYPMIDTDCGSKSASTTRILAHELGHLTGTRDNGTGNMNNVSTWENPIMYPLEGYKRIAY